MLKLQEIRTSSLNVDMSLLEKMGHHAAEELLVYRKTSAESFFLLCLPKALAFAHRQSLGAASVLYFIPKPPSPWEGNQVSSV